jgi:hypothetical protein
MTNDRPGSAGTFLIEHQRLATSGARAVMTFHAEGQLRLAVPQLAIDIPRTMASMHAGDSDVDMLLYRWFDGRFIEDGGLPVPGGEDATHFEIGGVDYLATASIRTGGDPYDYNTDSVLYRRTQGRWEPCQRFPTFAAKQWHHFRVGTRRFLALAQGVTVEGPVARNPRSSRIFEWKGDRFVDFQTLEGSWGYNWVDFELDGRQFLGYADHMSASGLMTWAGESFVPFQEFAPQGGRAFEFFHADGEAWLAFANLTGESSLYRWRSGRFAVHQSLGGPGAREFAVARTARALYLVKINFIHGTPAAPKADLMSCLYRWDRGRLEMVEEFPTSGGTDAAVFAADGQIFIAVSNSLSPEIRFRQDSVVYRLQG